MGLPTVIKTWQRSLNNTILAQGTFDLTTQQLLLSIKNGMKAFGSGGWTVYTSCNAGGSTGSPTGTVGVTGDGVDHWTTAADVVGTPAGTNSRHPWMVLQQAGIATHFQVCWDMNNTSSPNLMTLVVSPSAGFGSAAAGTAIARPTATDEIVILTAAAWGDNSGTDKNFVYNLWQSTDGACFRCSIESGGSSENTFWLHDVPQNVVSGWSSPSCSINLAATTGSNAFASLYNMTGQGRQTGNFTITTTGESNGSTLLANLNSVGTQVNDFSGQWPFFGIGISSVTASNRGRHGSLFDLWWRPSAVNPGDTFPNTSTNRQFVAFGRLIHTWTSGSDVPLLS